MADKMIGGFRILAEINSGGQGQVFKAVCEKPPFEGIEPGTVVALKVMAVHDEDISTLTKKCKQLTSIFGQFVHPNVVRYYGCFVVTDTFDVIRAIEVQEWLRGETLKQRLARNPHGLDADEALRVVDAALTGLEYVSENGIVHRDVKSCNIFLCHGANGVISGVKLIDFEIAHQKDDATTIPTTTGKVVGTFDYMAPEFMNLGFCGDERSDVFSMGVVMHETLTGSMPYQRSVGGSGRADFAFVSRWDGLRGAGTNPIQISSDVNLLLTHCRAVLERALAPLPENRYESFAAFRAALKCIRYHDIRNGDKVYRILQFIGKGGYGEVFKARLLESGRVVAIKHILMVVAPGYTLRFRREARVMARFNDSCFAHLIDFFEKVDVDSREAFLVMDFLPGMPGSSLRDAIKRADGTSLPIREVLLAFARFAHGLSVLHSNGIIHRDIKPSNLYYPEGHPERVAIMDFAIARDINGTKTSGQVPGTLDYMPPEVALAANRGGPGADIYALGLCLYEALSGKTAYPRLPQGMVAYSALFERAKAKAMPDFSDPVVVANAPLHELLVKMTHPELSQRLVDAAEVERTLEAILKDDELDTDVPTLDDLYNDESNTALPPQELMPQEILEGMINEQKKRRRLRIFRMLLIGGSILGIGFFMHAFYGVGSVRFRVFCDLLMVVWLGVICMMELKTRRIPNLLAFGGLALWLLIDFASGGLGGLISGVKASGIGLLLTLVPFLQKAIGGGAVKMMVACCAYVGCSRLLPFGLMMIAIGCIMGVGVMIDGYWNRSGGKAHKADGHRTCPCSPIIAIAMLVTLLFKWLGWI